MANFYLNNPMATVVSDTRKISASQPSSGAQAGGNPRSSSRNDNRAPIRFRVKLNEARSVARQWQESQDRRPHGKGQLRYSRKLADSTPYQPFQKGTVGVNRQIKRSRKKPGPATYKGFSQLVMLGMLACAFIAGLGLYSRSPFLKKWVSERTLEVTQTFVPNGPQAIKSQHKLPQVRANI